MSNSNTLDNSKLSYKNNKGLYQDLLERLNQIPQAVPLLRAALHLYKIMDRQRFSSLALDTTSFNLQVHTCLEILSSELGDDVYGSFMVDYEYGLDFVIDRLKTLHWFSL